LDSREAYSGRKTDISVKEIPAEMLAGYGLPSAV
jgi:hypothetical protein